MTKYILHPTTPNKREINQIAEAITAGAIAIIPTDSSYALACAMNNKIGIERIVKATGKSEKKAKLSLLCDSLKSVADHTLPYDNHVFKTMKRYTPGPYTFILNANNSVTKFFKENKKEIGIRIPKNDIVQALLSAIDTPLISTTITQDELGDLINNFEAIEEKYLNNVDIIVDGQVEEIGETTVLDCTKNEIEVVRQGLGLID
jgi:tRNA threonylcarbamoyl adenosine modification protein (Sua5/YciO/YrdC/YwlC family)